MPSRTKARPQAVAKLPPLQVAIYRDGTQLSTVEIPDPREVFVRAFEELNPDCKAEPMGPMEPAQAKRYFRHAGKGGAQ